MKLEDIKAMALALEAVKKNELDKVDPKQATKPFDKRDDKDINNDGKTDGTDKYLAARRRAVTNTSKSKGSEKGTETEVQESSIISVAERAKLFNKRTKSESSDKQSDDALARYIEKTKAECNNKLKESIKEAFDAGPDAITKPLSTVIAPKELDGTFAIDTNKIAERTPVTNAVPKNAPPAQKRQQREGYVVNLETRTPISTRQALRMMEDRASQAADATTPQEMGDDFPGKTWEFINTHSVAEPAETDINQAIDKNTAEVEKSLQRSVNRRPGDNSYQETSND